MIKEFIMEASSVHHEAGFSNPYTQICLKGDKKPKVVSSLVLPGYVQMQPGQKLKFTVEKVNA